MSWQDLETGVYRITCGMTDKVYIGETTTTFKRRWSVHIRELNAGVHANPYLQNAWNKYGGEQGFIFEVLERCPREKCIEREAFWIKRFNATDNEVGYNVCIAGTNNTGAKRSEESRKRMSEAGKKRVPMTDEHRANISKASKGRKLSQEHKDAVSAAMKGKPKSEEHKAKIAATVKSKPLTEEQVQRKLEALASPEARAKMSASWTYNEERAKASAEAVRRPEVRAKIAATLRARAAAGGNDA